MITLNKIGDYHNRQVLEIECLKSDEKPIGTIDGLVITNGSKLHELDGSTYEYDEQNKTWVLQPKSSGGADGREIELQKTQTHIQWRYVGTEEWFDLVSLDEISFKHSDFTPEQLQALKGAKGDKGNPGANGTNGKDGLSIKSTQINDSGHLILTFSDESTKDVGKVTGENGESAYQIAIKLGYKGTEQEWIESLKYDHSEEFTKLAAEVRNTASNIAAERQQITQNTNDVTKLKEDLKGFVPKQQGVENNGKILGIGADGMVVPVDKPSGGTGSGVDLDVTLTSPDKAAPANLVGSLKEELVDIRTGVDNIVYKSAGEAVRNQISTVTGSIQDLQDNYLVFPFIKGEYVHADTGEFRKNEDYVRTDFISVEGMNGEIHIDKVMVKSSENAWYDENKTFISYFLIKPTGGIIDIPNNAKYFVLSGKLSDNFLGIKITSPTGLLLDTLKSRSSFSKSLYLQLTNNQNWIRGKYVDHLTGEIKDARAWEAIEIIPVGDYIITNANGTLGGAIVFLTEKNSVLASYSYTFNVDRVFSVPTGTAKVRLCNRWVDSDITPYVIGGKIPYDAKTLDNIANVIDYTVKKLAIIGDSISSDIPSTNNISWVPMFLRKVNSNIDLQRFTVPGKKLRDSLISDTENVSADTDIVIVLMGRNDVSYTIGDIDAIMKLPLSEVPTDTVMGVYRKALETLKNRLKDNAVIFCIAPVTDLLIDSWKDSVNEDFKRTYETFDLLRQSIKNFVIAEGGSNNGWFFANGRDWFSLEDNIYYNDNTHPNMQGEAIMASKIYESIIPIRLIE